MDNKGYVPLLELRDEDFFSLAGIKADLAYVHRSSGAVLFPGVIRSPKCFLLRQVAFSSADCGWFRPDSLCGLP